MRIALLLALSLALGLGGCGCSDEAGPEPLSGKELEQIPALTPMQLQELLAAHKGKVVVLAVWSVRREASVAMYPKLNELLQGDEPVVIAVNIDRVTDVRDKVLPILRKEQPKFLNRVLSVGPEALASFIDANKWAGQLPALALYDRAGQKAAAFYGDGALDKARAKLPSLLKKPKP